MKPYLKQTVSVWSQVESAPEVPSPEGYYLAFAAIRGDSWHLIWAPYMEAAK